MITSKQMRELEDYAESKGVSTLDLMENAGKAFVDAVHLKYDLDKKRVIIFAGVGNNGGDGFVAARYFAEENQVVVLLFGDSQKLKEETMKNFVKLNNKGLFELKDSEEIVHVIENPINVVVIQHFEDLKQFHFQKNVELLLVDAMLGTGIQGEIKEPISLGIDLFNSTKGIKIAVDLPSGMDPDTGKLAKKYCEVDYIITFHDFKAGMQSVKDKTVVVNIGIPNENDEGNSDEVKIEKL